MYVLSPGHQQAKRLPLHSQRRAGVRGLPAVLRHRAAERSAVREVAAGGEEEPGAAGSGQDDLRGAEHHRAYGAEDSHAHAESHSVSTSTGRCQIALVFFFNKE